MQMTDEEIRTHYRQAKNRWKDISVLADLNCCTKEEMIAKLEELGIELPDSPTQGRKPYTKLDTEKAMELYRAGASQREIARQLGVSQTTVRSWMTRERLGSAGEPKKEKATPDPEPVPEPVMKAHLLKYVKIRGAYVCSSCGTVYSVASGNGDVTPETRYCPWCGADMSED